MRINKQAISQYQSTIGELPAGYSVEKLGFGRWALYFNGKLLKEFENQRYAHNGASRHNRGQAL